MDVSASPGLTRTATHPTEKRPELAEELAHVRAGDSGLATALSPTCPRADRSYQSPGELLFDVAPVGTVRIDKGVEVALVSSVLRVKEPEADRHGQVGDVT